MIYRVTYCDAGHVHWHEPRDFESGSPAVSHVKTLATLGDPCVESISIEVYEGERTERICRSVLHGIPNLRPDVVARWVGQVIRGATEQEK